MLPTFRRNEKYFNACVFFIINLILNFPQFNNYLDVCDVFDIYIRKFVLLNTHLSYQIAVDCIHMIEFFYDIEYINLIKGSFDNEVDAYHYLAILVQFQRQINKFNLNSLSPLHQFNPNNMYNLVIDAMT